MPGINDKRISPMASRISVTPPNCGYRDATVKTTEKAMSPTNERRATEESPARRRVREAMTEFQNALPAPATDE